MRNNDFHVENNKGEKETESQTASIPFKFTEEAKRKLEGLNEERLRIKMIYLN